MKNRLRQITSIAIFLTLAIFFISNSSNPPDGFTGAPGDSLCNTQGCHFSAGSFTGNVIISGLPTTVQPSSSHTITVEINNFDMSASRAGFQLVALDDSNNNAGSITGNAEVAAATAGSGRIYAEHSPAKSFSGGMVTFSFDWTAPSSGNNITMYVSANIANGSGTSGDVIVTNTASTTIAVPLSASIGSVSSPSCFGGNDGMATAIVSGGVSPYTYNWSDGQTTSIATNLPSGSYTVTISDNAGAAATASINLSQPTEIMASVAGTNLLCNGGMGGQAIVTASGGTITSDYNYSWSTSPPQNTSTATNLSAGEYTVTVTDDNGCSLTETISISEPPSLEITISGTTDASCNGGMDGQATATAAGGTVATDYSYSWSTSLTQNTPTATGLSLGTYTVTVTDDNGCSATEIVNIGESENIEITVLDLMDVSCNGAGDGSISITVSGGVNPYSYSWTGDAMGQGDIATGLSAGVYEVTVTDQNNCGSSLQITVNEPAAITINILDVEGDDGSESGSITVDVAGGTPSYGFSWQDATTNEISTMMNPSNLPFGEYTLFVTDANECTANSETIQIIDLVDVINPELENYISIYPNPLQEELSVNWNTSEIAELSIFDLKGKIILVQELSSGINNIRMEHVPSGVYFLQFKLQDQLLFKKIVKE